MPISYVCGRLRCDVMLLLNHDVAARLPALHILCENLFPSREHIFLCFRTAASVSVSVVCCLIPRPLKGKIFRVSFVVYTFARSAQFETFKPKRVKDKRICGWLSHPWRMEARLQDSVKKGRAFFCSRYFIPPQKKKEFVGHMWPQPWSRIVDDGVIVPSGFKSHTHTHTHDTHAHGQVGIRCALMPTALRSGPLLAACMSFIWMLQKTNGRRKRMELTGLRLLLLLFFSFLGL